MSLPLTLAANWQSFESVVIRSDASDIQRNEMRRSFHAGFCRAWEILSGHVADMGESEAVAFMNGLEAEILAYMQVLMDAANLTPDQLSLISADTDGPSQ